MKCETIRVTKNVGQKLHKYKKLETKNNMYNNTCQNISIE